MDVSLILLIGGAAAIVIALLFCFFGYRLARFLQPITGLLVIEGLIYIFIYPMLALDSTGTWLFFAGTALAFFVILFVFKRIAGFFTGLLGAGLFLLYIIYAFGLQSVPYLYPIFFTLAIIAGALAVAYRRAGVIVTTSLLGGCVVAFAGLYMIFVGVNGAEFAGQGNVLVPLARFLAERGLIVAGVSLGIAAITAFLQFAATGKKQVLSAGEKKEDAPQKRRRRKNAQTWMSDGESMKISEGSSGSSSLD